MCVSFTVNASECVCNFFFFISSLFMPTHAKLNLMDSRQRAELFISQWRNPIDVCVCARAYEYIKIIFMYYKIIWKSNIFFFLYNDIFIVIVQYDVFYYTFIYLNIIVDIINNSINVLYIDREYIYIFIYVSSCIKKNIYIYS